MKPENFTYGEYILSCEGWYKMSYNMWQKSLLAEDLPMVRLIYNDELQQWEFVHAEYPREFINNVKEVNGIWQRIYNKNLIKIPKGELFDKEYKWILDLGIVDNASYQSVRDYYIEYK